MIRFLIGLKDYLELAFHPWKTYLVNALPCFYFDKSLYKIALKINLNRSNRYNFQVNIHFQTFRWPTPKFILPQIFRDKIDIEKGYCHELLPNRYPNPQVHKSHTQRERNSYKFYPPQKNTGLDVNNLYGAAMTQLPHFFKIIINSNVNSLCELTKIIFKCKYSL